jgi:hypothetical protein
MGRRRGWLALLLLAGGLAPGCLIVACTRTTDQPRPVAAGGAQAADAADAALRAALAGLQQI